MNDDPHKPLRDDVRLLGDLFGETLESLEGDAVFRLVEEVRTLAKRAHADDSQAFQELADRLSGLSTSSAVPIARAFAQFLTLANIAEQHHRVRRRREYARDSGHGPQPGSCADAFARWHDAGLSPDALADALRSLRIELVLTAHPTEMIRRTLLQAYRRIGDLLAVRDRPDLTPDESDAALDELRREIATVWQTEEVQDRDMSPLDEVRGGPAVFEQTLWAALPLYVRQIGRGLANRWRSTRPPCASDHGSAAIATAIPTSRRRSRAGPPGWRGGWPPTCTRERSMPCGRSSRSARLLTNCASSRGTLRTVSISPPRRRGAPSTTRAYAAQE